MKCVGKLVLIFTIIISLFFTSCSSTFNKNKEKAPSFAIVVSEDARQNEMLAAKEIRRYLYLRTNILIPIVTSKNDQPPYQQIFVVASKNRPIALKIAEQNNFADEVVSLQKENYLLKTIETPKQKTVLVVGGDDIGTLYAAYDFIEQFGIRFYLHGDTIPDKKIALELPNINKVGKPLFKLRGIQPFHDFPEGPDWWNTDDYKAIISQLPKLRMNFIGLHCYPECDHGPEPTVWIGEANDIENNGNVKSSYPSYYAHTMRDGFWGYERKKTSDFSCGAAELFERDGFGPDVMDEKLPDANDMESCNRVFNRTGKMLNAAFTYAQKLGIKTCIGTETPLTIPKSVKKQLKLQDKDPNDLAIVKQIYKGMFGRIMKTHPLDYYWLWTDEGWAGDRAPDIEGWLAAKDDMLAAMEAMEDINAPFELATCGWVLGPFDDRSAFDKWIPKQVPMSCINHRLGFSPVEKIFSQIKARDLWAIPWVEDDGAMLSPQLWVGRLRRDAMDALNYGCSGLMGIHWRTRVLSANILALSRAAWDQSGWTQNYTEDLRNLPAEDLYLNWASTQFGMEAAPAIAKIFTSLDGVKDINDKTANIPRPNGWVIKGPGTIITEKKPWQEIKQQYSFIDELEDLRPQITGKGNLERFYYWLNTFQYTRTMAHIGCQRGLLDQIMEDIESQQDDSIKKQLALQQAIPARIKLSRLWEDMMRFEMARLTNTSELGEIANIEQQRAVVKMKFLTTYDETLSQIIGKQLPPEIKLSNVYTGPAHIVVPTIRSQIEKGQSLKLKVIILDKEQPKNAAIYYRPLGKGTFQKIPLTHIDRAVYNVTLPPAEEDFEYYIQANSSTGKRLMFPATAPNINQTVIVMP